MRQCPYCGGANPDDAAVCQYCGHSLESMQRCPNCGNSVSPEDAICPYCGFQLKSSSNPTPPVSPQKKKRKLLPTLIIAAAVCFVIGVAAAFASGLIPSPNPPEPTPTPSSITITSAPTKKPTPTPAKKATSTPRPTSTVKPTPTKRATSTPRPTSAVKPTATPRPASNAGKVVCLDPGHQRSAMDDVEPVGPGSDTMTTMMTPGGQGAYSGQWEYETNLEIGLKLRDELETRGYIVVMTRTSNGVTLSNSRRTGMANDAGADIFVRIHCTETDDSTAEGMMAVAPTDGNPYLSSDIIESSQILAETLLDSVTSYTGRNSLGVQENDDTAGINWADMPVASIELGDLSNESDDYYVISDSGQDEIVRGLADGIDTYFSR